jgi:hypothetical protein
MNKSDKQQEAAGKTVSFGTDQLNNPTPVFIKNIFRLVLYLSALWAVIAPSITELDAGTLAMINKYLLLGVAVVNITIKFFGYDFKS